MSATNVRHQATRPHPNPNQVGKPATADPCPGHGHEQYGDKRDGTCLECGRQVDGRPLPVRLDSSLGIGVDHSTEARKTRKYRPAA